MRFSAVQTLVNHNNARGQTLFSNEGEGAQVSLSDVTIGFAPEAAPLGDTPASRLERRRVCQHARPISHHGARGDFGFEPECEFGRVRNRLPDP
jgi:hypothetical protein